MRTTVRGIHSNDSFGIQFHGNNQKHQSRSGVFLLQRYESLINCL